MSRLRLSKIATPAAPPSGTAELFYSTPDSRLEAIDENGNLAYLGPFSAAATHNLIRVFMISASGTYTPAAGVRALYVECVGGGGGGGGAVGAVSKSAQGSGGGSGGYSAAWITALAASYTVTIGAGGTPGNSAGSTPGGGGNTSFGSVCIANGGGAGSSMAAQTGPTIYGPGAGGVAGTGDFTAVGSPGQNGVTVAPTIGLGADGGSSIFGGGGQGIGTNSGQAGGGQPGTFGGGGSGASTTNSATSAPGGTGGAGVVRVWEFA